MIQRVMDCAVSRDADSLTVCVVNRILVFTPDQSKVTPRATVVTICLLSLTATLCQLWFIRVTNWGKT